MNRFMLVLALLLGACSHGETKTVAVQPVAPIVVATQTQSYTCADSFNHALSNLTSALEIEGTYAMSVPVTEHATAYEGRVSRY